MWVKLGEPVGTPCGQTRGQAQPVHRLSISGCPRVERSEPSGREAIIHISTGSDDCLLTWCLAAKHLPLAVDARASPSPRVFRGSACLAASKISTG